VYNLVIADDEKNIREGLSKFIDWKDLGFNVVMKCEDGEEVIDYINTMSVDVVLCDIRMNRKSGLDVAKFVSENPRDIKVVLMSGYQEFEYAKKALEYNVVSYIVKPIEMREIKEKFIKIKSDLDVLKNINEKMNEEKKKVIDIQRDFSVLIDMQSNLIESFLNFDKIFIYSIFKDISNKVVNMPFNSGIKFLENTLALLLNKIIGFYLGLNIKEDLIDIIRNISESQNYNRALEVFELWIDSAVNGIEENNNSNSKLVIKKANKYIEKNYMNDLTLEKVSEIVFLSPVYLSKVYKKEMGINFIDYVTKIRIERSKELLRNRNLKVYEISELVGYKNLKYFYKIFKRYTGYTPNKYREILVKDKCIKYKEDK
jgi:two-component system, response regulator YesN